MTLSYVPQPTSWTNGAWSRVGADDNREAEQYGNSTQSESRENCGSEAEEAETESNREHRRGWATRKKHKKY